MGGSPRSARYGPEKGRGLFERPVHEREERGEEARETVGSLIRHENLSLDAFGEVSVGSSLTPGNTGTCRKKERKKKGDLLYFLLNDSKILERRTEISW